MSGVEITKMINSIAKTLADHMITKLVIIQFDITSPFRISLQRKRYFLLIIACFTRKNWVQVLKEKSDAPGAFTDWEVAVKLQADTKIKAARSENALELIQTIEGWRTSQGTEPQFTIIALSHQNGPAERSIRTPEACMYTMFNDTSLPLDFWDEPGIGDVYLRNRTNTGPIIDGKIISPEGAWTRVTP
jgi:hypothetical protein